MDHDDLSKATVSRRGFLTGLSTVTAGSLIAANAATSNAQAESEQSAFLQEKRHDFEGAHQAGIATPGQAHLNLIAFTIRNGVDARGVQRLLRLWTEDAARLTQGKVPLGDLEPEMVITPANLTITCGFGARFFDVIGKADIRPKWLGPLPKFSRDELQKEWGEADIVLQICCDDPLTLSHATRHMIRAGIDYASTKWFQQGFLHAKGGLKEGETPRNLFGLKDGTVNPSSDSEYDDIVWIDSGPKWAHGGSCMVVRRITMNLDTWEILDRGSREIAFGRKLDSGAPLSGGDEFAAADFDKSDHLGLPMIDPLSHMARSAPPADDPNQKLRRRAYNFDHAPEAGSEMTSNSGLVFICFQKDPLKQFVPIQQRLDEADRLNQWISHIGSAVFFCPPGVGKGNDEFWGAGLFEA